MGELTDVASAKRAVLGVFNESPDDELDEVLDRTTTCGSLASSWDKGCFSSLSKFCCWLPDMLDVPADVRL